MIIGFKLSDYPVLLEIMRKVVVAKYGESKKYECVNCDFKSNDDDEAIKHNKDFKHEIWKRRMSYTIDL